MNHNFNIPSLNNFSNPFGNLGGQNHNGNPFAGYLNTFGGQNNPNPFGGLGGLGRNTNPFDLTALNNPLDQLEKIIDPQKKKKAAVKTYPSYGQLKSKLSKNPNAAGSTLDIKDLQIYQMRDNLSIYKSGKEMIAGYLNLTSQDGWKEGHNRPAGGAFTRLMLVTYYLEKKDKDPTYRSPVIEKVIHGFPYVGSQGDSLTVDSYRPKKSRVCYDADIAGWEGHKISRLVGNVGSVYDPAKPFFEILINSQRDSATNTLCQPFFVSIFENEKELDERRKALATLTDSPFETAYYQFYSFSLVKPEDYLAQNVERLGPKSTHLLKGLIFLQNETISAQKSGNCWIKQPMRACLASLFIEYHTDLSEITPEASWDQAKIVYKRMQKSVAVPYVTKLVNTIEMTDQMKKSALKSIETQKKL